MSEKNRNLISITAEEKRKITLYIDLLKAYNEKINIYSKNAYNKLDFHINDSVYLASLIPEGIQYVIDLGSGSGLPSILLAIKKSNLTIIAIESKGKKISFLDNVKTELQLKNYQTIHSNVYEINPNTIPQNNCLITAKAFGSTKKIIHIAKKLFQIRPITYIPSTYEMALKNQKKYRYKLHQSTNKLYNYTIIPSETKSILVK